MGRSAFVAGAGYSDPPLARLRAPAQFHPRKKNTRDAVRSAIERLTGRKMPIESPKEGAPQAPDEGQSRANGHKCHSARRCASGSR